MGQIHRKEVEEIGKEFLAPANITIAWHQERHAFSIWYNSDDPVVDKYVVAVTGDEVPEGFELADSICVDGFHMGHLLKKRREFVTIGTDSRRVPCGVPKPTIPRSQLSGTVYEGMDTPANRCC